MIEKILIVDDSPIARRILKKCIPKDTEYQFYEAGDGLEGLKQFKEISPDVTFLDLTMPVMNGMETLEEIKKVDQDAVVIVATADVQIKTIFKVMDLGALMVLKKPMSAKAVKDALLNADKALKNMR